MGRGFDGVRHHEAGATAVEYAIMISLIAVVIVVAVWGLGRSLQTDYECVEAHLSNTPSNPASVGC